MIIVDLIDGGVKKLALEESSPQGTAFRLLLPKALEERNREFRCGRGTAASKLPISFFSLSCSRLFQYSQLLCILRSHQLIRKV